MKRLKKRAKALKAVLKRAVKRKAIFLMNVIIPFLTHATKVDKSHPFGSGQPGSEVGSVSSPSPHATITVILTPNRQQKPQHPLLPRTKALAHEAKYTWCPLMLAFPTNIINEA